MVVKIKCSLQRLGQSRHPKNSGFLPPVQLKDRKENKARPWGTDCLARETDLQTNVLLAGTEGHRECCGDREEGESSCSREVRESSE